VVDGGDEPNVVPSQASIWFYFRERNYQQIQDLFSIGDSVARGAAMMTGTELASVRILGSAWPGHFNRTIAETMYANIQQVGLPEWSQGDNDLARGVQREVGGPEAGLATELELLGPALREDQRSAGYADDIGDISWKVPTAVLRFPANIPGLPGHHWANAIAMATPIAHKGATAGAKVQAMTMLDFLLRPELVKNAWDYFNDVKTADVTYTPLIRREDQPAIEINKDIMEQFRPAMREFYFDPTGYDTYLEQLGVNYPTFRGADGSCGVGMIQ